MLCRRGEIGAMGHFSENFLKIPKIVTRVTILSDHIGKFPLLNIKNGGCNGRIWNDCF